MRRLLVLIGLFSLLLCISEWLGIIEYVVIRALYPGVEPSPYASQGFFLGLVFLIIAVISWGSVIWLRRSNPKPEGESAVTPHSSDLMVSGPTPDKTSAMSSAAREYFDLIARRLSGEGFVINRSVSIGQYESVFVARRVKREWLNLTKRWVFGIAVTQTDDDAMNEFSNVTTLYAIAELQKSLKRRWKGITFRPEVGLRPVAVVVCDRFDESLKKRLTNFPPRSNLKFMEYPVLVSIRDRQIFYYLGKPTVNIAGWVAMQWWIEKRLGF